MGVIKVKRHKEVQEHELQLRLEYYQRLLQENNIVEFDESQPHPDFDLACEKFRTTCGKISALIGEAFNGSYDDIERYKDNEQMKTAEGIALKDELNLYNNLCIHEGNKIGLPPPYWFFKCWGIEQ